MLIEGSQYAIKDDKVVHISEVERGLACGCICPACKGKMVARKGEKNAWCFAHHISECKYAFETLLHYMAKEILLKHKQLVLPKISCEFPNERIWSKAEGKYTFDDVKLEARLKDIIPDVILIKGTVPLIVEITVTHGIDKEKFEKIKELGISVIEVDLGMVKRNITMEELEKILIYEVRNKKWVYNAKFDKMDKDILKLCDKLEMKNYKVDVTKVKSFCYIAKHDSRNLDYVVYGESCYNCMYMYDYKHEHTPGYYGIVRDKDFIFHTGYIKCACRNSISSYKSYNEYLKKSRKGVVV